MAPLPTTNTARLEVDYVSNSSSTAQQHTMRVRYNGASVNPFDAQGDLLAVLNGIGEANFATGWRVLQVRNGAQGDPNTFPVSADPDLLAFLGSGSLTGWNAVDETVEWRFVGRGAPSGRHVSLSIYGLVVARPATFREDIVVEPANWVRNATVAMNLSANAGAVFLNIAGDPTFWYGYANWQQNSYWESELRS